MKQVRCSIHLRLHATGYPVYIRGLSDLNGELSKAGLGEKTYIANILRKLKTLF